MLGRSANRTFGLAAAVLLTAACLVTASVDSAGASVHLVKVGSFREPTDIISDPADPNRLFVTERLGRIEVSERGRSSTLLDLGKMGLVSVDRDAEFEKGLFSMAFAPDYRTSNLFYVSYARGPGAGIEEVDEFRMNPRTGRVAPGSRRPVIAFDHSIGIHHWAGKLAFGRDGYLYMSTGDGQMDEPSQDLGSLLGKILRIDPRASAGESHSVPPDNPFVTVAGARPEIWSYGLRNPWRFSFDSATGDLIIGDVGLSHFEEIDYLPASSGLGRGVNFGWPCREGFAVRPGPPAPACVPGATFTGPAFAYPHTAIGGGDDRCSIIGGFVARDRGLGRVVGRYLYADFCAHQIRSVRLGVPGGTRDRLEARTPRYPEAFGRDACGRLYIGFGLAGVYRLQGSRPTVCKGEPRRSKLTLSRKHRGAVRRGARVVLRARIFPCAARGGSKVGLRRGRRVVARAALNGRCVASFTRRIPRSSTFRAFAPGDARHLAAVSRPLRVRVKSRR